MTKSKIIDILENKIKGLKNELVALKIFRQSDYKVISQVATNDSGICVAYLSCNKDSFVESIELTLSVIFEEKFLSIETDIYWSDGSIIKEFGITKIEWNDFASMKYSLEKYFDRISGNELVEYAKIVIQLM